MRASISFLQVLNSLHKVRVTIQGAYNLSPAVERARCTEEIYCISAIMDPFLCFFWRSHCRFGWLNRKPDRLSRTRTPWSSWDLGEVLCGCSCASREPERTCAWMRSFSWESGDWFPFRSRDECCFWQFHLRVLRLGRSGPERSCSGEDSSLPGSFLDSPV